MTEALYSKISNAPEWQDGCDACEAGMTREANPHPTQYRLVYRLPVSGMWRVAFTKSIVLSGGYFGDFIVEQEEVGQLLGGN